jgi:hypothetical protein
MEAGVAVLEAKPLLIFNVGASDGAIEAGATVLDTVGGVVGDILAVVKEEDRHHSDASSFSSSTAVSKPSSSSLRFIEAYFSQLNASKSCCVETLRLLQKLRSCSLHEREIEAGGGVVE